MTSCFTHPSPFSLQLQEGVQPVPSAPSRDRNALPGETEIHLYLLQSCLIHLHVLDVISSTSVRPNVDRVTALPSTCTQSAAAIWISWLLAILISHSHTNLSVSLLLCGVAKCTHLGNLQPNNKHQILNFQVTCTSSVHFVSSYLLLLVHSHLPFF